MNVNWKLKLFSNSKTCRLLAHTSVVFLLVLVQLASSLKLESNGSYHVVVAIDRNTQKNDIENDYIPNLKHGLQRLSDFLHGATDKTFYIKSADIILPEHWNFPADEIATTDYFENSDIRISHEFQEPYVYNPILCGKPGEYIQLPYDFFREKDIGGRYGKVGGVLLTQWARYRYGVWEEHGYPLDSSFPYFFQKPGNETWSANYCANIELSGEVKNLHGKSCDRENPEVNPPRYDCRFYPNDTIYKPTSSIMSFHFLDSVQQFCNNETHNQFVPNRQNVYCNYRSVQEVIEASPDWEIVTEENAIIPRAIEFKVKRMSTKPLLSFVLDGGLSPIPAFVLTSIKDNLKILVNGSLQELPAGLIGTVGSFSAEAERNGYSLTEDLPWMEVGKHKEDFEKAIDSSFQKTSGFRNFALAIKEALDNIKLRKHEYGSVMVIVKTAAATEIEKHYYEDEVIAAAKELGVNLHIFEVLANALNPSLNLGNLALETGGTYMTISPSTLEADILELRARMDNISKELNDFQFQSDKKFRTIYKTVVTTNAEIALNVADASNVYFHLMPIDNVEITDPVIEIIEEGIPHGIMASVSLDEKIDWYTNTNTGAGLRRKTYKGVFPIENPLNESINFKVTFNGGGSSYLLICGEFETEVELKSDEIQVFLSTTAGDNGIIDLDEGLQFEAIQAANAPFAIFAKLQHDGFPIKNMGDKVSVQAIVNSKDTVNYITVNMVDDGLRSPDLTSNDGIFSGTFVPQFDGMYMISIKIDFMYAREVEITTTEADESSSTTEGTDPRFYRNSGRIISEDQSLLGCGSDFSGCWNTILPFDFVKVVDYPKYVTFVNTATYIAVPQKILDLKIIPLDQYDISIQWTSPGFVESTGTGIAYVYFICRSTDFATLLNADAVFLEEKGDCRATEDGSRPDLPYPNIPGSPEEINIPILAPKTFYYAIWSLHYTDVLRYSPVSNIVTITSVENVTTTIPPETPSTTTTTTSTTTTTTTTTTEPPPTTTTTTTERPSTASTSRRTTTERTTTPRRTTTTRTSTTTPASTEEPKIEHWYQKPSGYITLSVFGALAAVVICVGLGFMWWKNKNMVEAKENLIREEGPIV